MLKEYSMFQGTAIVRFDLSLTYDAGGDDI